MNNTHPAITTYDAQNAMTLIGVLKRNRARQLNADNAEDLRMALCYLRMGVVDATEDDARTALAIVKSNISADALWEAAR